MAQRNPEATRQRLLDAGLAEFSEKGIAGGRVEAIVDRAGTNKRMLYHYFGSKEGLFREILAAKLRERVATPSTAEVISDPTRLSRRQDVLAADRDYVRLLTWEALEAGPEGEVANEEARREFYQRWVARVTEEQEAGRFPADLDPAQFVLAELSLSIMPLVLPQLTRLITGGAVTDPELAVERRRFLDALAGRLLAQPADAEPG